MRKIKKKGASVGLSLCYVTISVSNLEKSKRFYEDICGFKPDIYYEPTRWQSYFMGGISGGFGIIESSDSFVPPRLDIVEFFVDDVETYWKKIKGKVKVHEKLKHTPWGSYKFIIEDPDNNCISFVQR